MDALYLFLNLGSISVPFIFSFHPKLQFYKFWKPLFISIILTMGIFIPWDIIFTQQGFWGFNNNYFLNTSFLHLPIEEWLFFICIPYACVFTHFALLTYLPNFKISKNSTKCISYIVLLLCICTCIVNYNKWYTFVNFLYAIMLLSIALKYHIKLLQSYYITFLVMLIPFFIVNGVLTGTGLTNPVVWYNNSENLNMRLGTIPIEDSVYAFTLILTNLMFTTCLKKRIK